LQPVCPEFAEQADPTALMPAHVEHHAAGRLPDPVHSCGQLGAAIAAPGGEYIPGQALGVDPHQHVPACVLRFLGDLSHHEGEAVYLAPVDGGAVANGGEDAVVGGYARFSRALDEGLGPVTVADQVLDGDQGQVMLAGKWHQLRDAHHRPVVVGQFADHRHPWQAGQNREVD
jgi:hypothetical protein